MTVRELQSILAAKGYYDGKIDGIRGPKTIAALKAFQTASGLQPDGIVGPHTLASLKPPGPQPTGTFDAVSARRLSAAHPLLYRVMNEARLTVEFRILDSQRGRAAQEKAFRDGVSKAHFGQSAHNWTPAIAVDVFPAPYNWNDLKAFDHAAGVILAVAAAQMVPLRWGGDWNMDGNPKDGWDKPHFELHPWREWAAKAEPYKG